MRYAICACLVLLTLSLAPLSVTTAEEAPQDRIEAVWRPQRLAFRYDSEGRVYACDILEHKVRRILTQLGAREQIIVRRVSCRDFAGTARLEVIMESPVIASPENIREITAYDSEDELSAASICPAPKIWKGFQWCGNPSRFTALARCIWSGPTAPWCSNCAGRSFRRCRCRSPETSNARTARMRAQG
jgi:hypothetical protein